MPINKFFGSLLGVDDLGSLGLPGSPTSPPPPQNPIPQQHKRADLVNAGYAFRRVPIYPPFANLCADPRVVYIAKPRPVWFGGNGVAAGAFGPTQLQFSEPTVIYARTGGAYDASGADLPVGRTGLDCFETYNQRVNGDLLDGTTIPILASAILGSGGLPGLFGGNGIFFERGTQINVFCTTLIANIRAVIVYWTIEEYALPVG